jgi:hypothetical protein
MDNSMISDADKSTHDEHLSIMTLSAFWPPSLAPSSPPQAHLLRRYWPPRCLRGNIASDRSAITPPDKKLLRIACRGDKFTPDPLKMIIFRRDYFYCTSGDPSAFPPSLVNAAEKLKNSNNR